MFLNERRAAVAIHVGTAAPAETDRAGVVQPAQQPLIDQGFGSLGFGREKRTELDGEFKSLRLGGLEHALGIPVGTGHGLFAVYVFAFLQGRHADRRVQVVMQTDVHRLDVRAGQQVVKICIEVRDAVASCHTLGMRRVHIRDSHQFDFRDGLVIIEVDLSDLAHPYHAYTQFTLHASLLIG